ncbi:MAG: AsnC family transcriptional regulator [Candidatus Latescibacteria bacterium]|jgi:Lrp/AsnC family transcriptional regulator, regulator for asnA, asnC and gidA|nr:AsnC family transcriptional regulator [Candidatus Latescibacterota bacterium]
MVIDEINYKIMKQLQDGRKSYREIAKSLSITENTVRARVKKLKKEGIFSITGLVNPDKIPDHTIAFVGVRIKNLSILSQAEEISKMKGVVSVSIVTGRYDLMMIVMFTKEFGLLQFYSDELSNISDVVSVETFIAYENFNLNLPYIL